MELPSFSIGGPSPEKALEFLQAGYIFGKPLTERQRQFFMEIAGVNEDDLEVEEYRYGGTKKYPDGGEKSKEDWADLMMRKRQTEASLAAERKRVEEVRRKVIEVAKKKDKLNSPTRTDLSYIKQGEYYCNTHTCEAFQDAGATTPSGKKVPVIPGNIQWEGMAQSLGYVPVTNFEPGDVVQEKVFRTEDYNGRKINHGKGSFVPAHSMIYAGRNDKGENLYYNSPGGVRGNYELNPETELVHGRPKSEYKMSGFRYVGNTPSLETELHQLQERLKETPLQPITPISVTSIPMENKEQMPILAAMKHGGQPCTECGEGNQGLTGAVERRKQSFFDYIRRNTNKAMMMEEMGSLDQIHSRTMAKFGTETGLPDYTQNGPTVDAEDALVNGPAFGADYVQPGPTVQNAQAEDLRQQIKFDPSAIDMNSGTDYMFPEPDRPERSHQQNMEIIGDNPQAPISLQPSTRKGSLSFDGNDIALGAIAGLNGLAYMFEGNERNAQAAHNARQTMGDAVFQPVRGKENRGDYDIHSGLFRPDQNVPVQYRAFGGPTGPTEPTVNTTDSGAPDYMAHWDPTREYIDEKGVRRSIKEREIAPVPVVNPVAAVTRPKPQNTYYTQDGKYYQTQVTDSGSRTFPVTETTYNFGIKKQQFNIGGEFDIPMFGGHLIGDFSVNGGGDFGISRNKKEDSGVKSETTFNPLDAISGSLDWIKNTASSARFLQEGGEYELDEKEIARLKALGYEIEELD